MATIIIVDQIGKRSKVAEKANEIGGNLVQMSASYWPKQVANILHDKLEYDTELRHVADAELEMYLTAALKKVPLEDYIGVNDGVGEATDAGLPEDDELEDDI